MVSAHLGLLHGVEVKVEALEVYDEVVREGLDGAPLVGVQRHRPTLACFVAAVFLFPFRHSRPIQSTKLIHHIDKIDNRGTRT